MSGPATDSQISWTDSHCHLQDDYREESSLDELLLRAADAGVDRLICIGTGPETSRRALELARRCAEGGGRVWATAGLHPHDASVGVAPIAELLTTEVQVGGHRSPGELVAVGECGLDYYYEHSPSDVQRAAFVEQIGLAKRLGLTLVVHSREAWEDTLEILAREGPPDRLVLHCFTGGPDEARRCLDLGAYLSFSGILTFKNADELREAARLCPGERMLVETDAPFLAPVPHRGKANEPAWVALVGAALAGVRGETVAEVAARTRDNAITAFDLEP